jgi:hypothetical protein
MFIVQATGGMILLTCNLVYVIDMFETHLQTLQKTSSALTTQRLLKYVMFISMTRQDRK